MVPRFGQGHHHAMSHRSFIWICLLPLAVVTAAFFLLPMAQLIVVGAAGPRGLTAYLAILTEPRYRATLINTVVLAAATTIATLVIATIAGLFLQRHRFPGRAVLIAMLTFPLAFPGVVVGFLIILLAGRQGLIGAISNTLTGEKIVFAYSIFGLFFGYLYFSIPRVILTIMLGFTLLVAAFLVVPVVLSISAGVTVNYFRGIQSGVTLQWVMQVWDLYAGEIGLSFVIAFATLAVTLIVGVPAAYALHLRGGKLSRIVQGIIT